MKVIDKKIVGVGVKSTPAPVQYRKRERALSGATYKVTMPTVDAAYYVTVNDFDGRPFEMFINTRDPEAYQWVTALTRVISAIMRVEPDSSFLVDELKAVHDPRGGAFVGKKYVPSLVAAIGDALGEHFQSRGLLSDAPAPEVAAYIEQKGGGVPGATMCKKCNNVAVVVLDGCATCTNCGDSKCG